MEISIIGFGVALALLLAGAVAGAPLIAGLFAAIPFGATAFATIGGSSPLIYTLFALLIIASAALRASVLHDLGVVLARMPLAWLLIALAIYAVAGAMLMPRLFAGKTTAFIPIEGIVTEVMLGPAPGNYTQTAYFLLGILVFFALAILTLRRKTLEKMTLGLFAFAISEAALGWADLAGKLAGAGDVLEPIRTASYALLTDVEQSGFWRIAGGCSEASAFAAFGLAALAFSYTYWRAAKSWLALALCVQLLLLLILSTSSTAYGGLGVLGLAAMLPLLWGALHGRLKPLDWFLLAAGGGAVAALMGLILYDEALFRPFTELFRTMVLEKASSVSGQERAYWNARSLKSFFDTYGLGIGLGSSRSSSWIVSVLAQFGLIGSAMICTAIAVMVRGMIGLTPTPVNARLFALASGARALGLGSLVGPSIAGSGADPGILFFASLAIVAACRATVQEEQHGVHGNRAPSAAATVPSQRYIAEVYQDMARYERAWPASPPIEDQ